AAPAQGAITLLSLALPLRPFALRMPLLQLGLVVRIAGDVLAIGERRQFSSETWASLTKAVFFLHLPSAAGRIPPILDCRERGGLHPPAPACTARRLRYWSWAVTPTRGTAMPARLLPPLLSDPL